jgi:hypothetical protein
VKSLVDRRAEYGATGASEDSRARPVERLAEGEAGGDKKR